MNLRIPFFILKPTEGRIKPFWAWLLISFFTAFLLTIVFLIDGIPLLLENYQYFSYFIFTFGYMFFVSRIVNNSHQKGFDELLRLGNLTEEEAHKWKAQFKDKGKMIRESLLALSVGLVHAYFVSLKSFFEGPVSYPAFQIFSALCTIFMWMVITQASSLFIRNMNVMNQFSQQIEIDILNTEQLMPLTKAGISSILGFIGAYSLFIVQGINIADLTNPAILVVFPCILWMLTTPLKRVRPRIIEAKEKEIELVNQAIEGNKVALSHSRIRKNLENINVIDLINYKKMIQQVPEIPVNIPTASRFIFYLIIPVLTWIAASMVDRLIDFLIL